MVTRGMKSLSQCRLYTFIDTAYVKGRQLSTVAQQLCDGGSDLIQLRAKSSTVEEIRRIAHVLGMRVQAASLPQCRLFRVRVGASPGHAAS